MISKRKVKAVCRDDATKIENYDKAIVDTETMWDCHHTNETKKKLSEITSIKNKDRHWYNNGIENKFCYDCPIGYVSGRLYRRNK